MADKPKTTESTGTESIDSALEEIKEAKKKLYKLREIVQTICDEKCNKKDQARVKHGLKRVEAMVDKQKKDQDNLK